MLSLEPLLAFLRNVYNVVVRSGLRYTQSRFPSLLNPGLKGKAAEFTKMWRRKIELDVGREEFSGRRGFHRNNSEWRVLERFMRSSCVRREDVV